MRALAIVALLLLGCEDEEVPKAPPAAAATVAKPRTQKQIDDCRDECEQSQIVAGEANDAALRACRARCAGSSTGGVAGAHEVPRSISRSPSLSAPPPVRPIGPNR